jgi:hypothetical protein
MSEVKVEIKADASALATGLAKAQKNIQNFGKDVTSNITDKLAGAFTGAAVLGGIGAVATGIMAFGKSIIDFAGNLQDTSEQLGITVEDLQGLHAAFRGGGASAEDVDKAMVKLTENMDAASKATGPARDRFDQLGISFEQIASGDPKAVLLAFGDAVRDSKNPVETLAAVIDLLGKSGKKLVPDLQQGSEIIKEIADKAKKISDSDASKFAAFGDQITEFGVTAKSFGVDIFNGFLKGIEFLISFEDKLTGLDKVMERHTAKNKVLVDQKKAALEAAQKVAQEAGIKDGTITAPMPVVDPKIKAAEEAQAKMDAENQKKADDYAEKQQAAAEKIADVEMSNAQEIEKQRRDQLDTEGQINALLEDRKNLQSEIASSSGMQKAQAQKDLIAVEKDLATAQDKAKNDMAAEGDEREKNNAADLKKKEDAAKKKKDLVDANKQGAEELAAQKKSGEARQSSILDQMVDEEMKTPMQRANEDRVAIERERIKNSLERRMKNLPPGQSKKMQQLAGELKDLTNKELPAEVKKLTDKLNEVVTKINKG